MRPRQKGISKLIHTLSRFPLAQTLPGFLQLIRGKRTSQYCHAIKDQPLITAGGKAMPDADMKTFAPISGYCRLSYGTRSFMHCPGCHSASCCMASANCSGVRSAVTI